MLSDAIRMIAAALCGIEKTVLVPVSHPQALGSVSELLLQLTAHAEISEDGTAYVSPVLRTPDPLSLRFVRLSRDLFFLYAGIAARLNLIMRVQTVEGDVTDAELSTLSAAVWGVLAYVKNGSGVLLSAFSANEGFDIAANAPETFVAGLLLGACLSGVDSAFPLERYADAPLVQCAIGAVNGSGGSIKETDHRVFTVSTLRGRFDEATGRRRKEKKQPCS